MVRSLVRRVLDDSVRNRRWCQTMCVYYCNDVRQMKSKRGKFPGQNVEGKEGVVKEFFLKTMEEVREQLIHSFVVGTLITQF